MGRHHPVKLLLHELGCFVAQHRLLSAQVDLELVEHAFEFVFDYPHGDPAASFPRGKSGKIGLVFEGFLYGQFGVASNPPKKCRLGGSGLFSEREIGMQPVGQTKHSRLELADQALRQSDLMSRV